MDEAMPSAPKRPAAGEDDPAVASKKMKLSTGGPELRSYEMMVYEEALRRNTIAVLDAGSGRTMIAVALINELSKDVEGADGRRKVIVFLAPSVDLVHQQYEVIKKHTSLSVMEYYGAKGIDSWDAKSWEEEALTYQVMVMTPQILLDALRKLCLRLDMAHLLILDECHNAIGNHPYTKIMKEFYCKPLLRPKVFGMTTSPHVKKGQLSELESILCSKIYAVEARNEINHVIVKEREVNRYYDPVLFGHDDLKTQLQSLLAKFNSSVDSLEESHLCKLEDTEEILNKSRKKSSSWYEDICHCLDDLGLLCAHEAAKICLESVLPSTATGYGSAEGSAEGFKQTNPFLVEVMHAIEGFLGQAVLTDLTSQHDFLEAIRLGYISPKLFELLQILNSSKPNQDHCLIFVERIITAHVLECFIKKFSHLSHLSVSHLHEGDSSAGGPSLKLQKETLDLFCNRKINILLIPNLAEERLHVPDCSFVVQFDLPRDVCSYDQSRKCACLAGSQYIIMLERGNVRQRDLLFDILKCNHSVMETAISRDTISIKQKLNNKDIKAFCVDSTGARVTATSSIDLVYRYCEKLPINNGRPTFQFNNSNGSSQCTLTLPPTAAFQTLVGPFCQNNHSAKQLVCLDACKKLHQLGALDDHLLPTTQGPVEINPSSINETPTSGAGTTKRKELHGTVAASALFGTWAHQKVGVTLQGYKLSFLCNKADQKYDNFVLLIDVALDKDVACLDIDLFLVGKIVKAFVSPCGPIQLDASQLEHAKRFHELFFNGTFGRLFKGSRSSGISREFLLMKDDIMLWNSSNMYMLLPLKSDCSQGQDNTIINWHGISETAATVEYFRFRHMPKADCRSDTRVEASVISGTDESNTLDMIHLANKTVLHQSLKDMIVIAVHTGKLYSVIDVVAGSSARSPFESSGFATFSDFFNNKYHIVLQHPEQPLLLVKHTHNPFNLLSSKFDTAGTASRKSKNSTLLVKRAPNNVHMPPELLVHIDVPLGVLKSLYLVPSLMHRMESLMLASQLRKEIGFTDSSIPSSLILEALTTSRCCEDFSSERLEHLGDSVLKYTVSCYLYLNFPEKQEGQLSSCRQLSVCNATLHKLGVNRNLQGYIRDAPFDPRRWVAPGQITNRPSPCECIVDNSSLTCKDLQTNDDSSIVIGKACDQGHRWMCSKTIADCVEAVIGAYYVGGGLTAALAVLKWLGVDVEVGEELVENSISSAPLCNSVSIANDVEMLEMKLGYKFEVKGLLVEAITIACQKEIGISYCYQRLEFLGDSVLDLLITSHLFRTYKDIDPGVLTDLRSASVNNERFAQCAVKHKLQKHLQYASELLLEQLTEYEMRLVEAKESKYMPLSNGFSRGPGVLGDMVESIAGAVLLDTKLDLNKVWQIFELLLSPIVTPDSLELPPMRELLELLSHRGYFLNTKWIMEGEMAAVELSVQLEKVYLTRKGRDKNRKAAKAQAASLLLKDLEKQGILRSRNPSNPKEIEGKPYDKSSLATDVHVKMSPRDRKNLSPEKLCDLNIKGPVFLSLNMKKGGPRTTLHELCQKAQWPMPRFESMEEKLSPEVASISAEGKKQLLQFVSTVTLHLPNSTSISLQGEKCNDKKSSQDSAALIILNELQTRGICCLN